MDIRLSPGDMNCHCHITAADRLYRCHLCELNLLLCLGHLK